MFQEIVLTKTNIIKTEVTLEFSKLELNQLKGNGNNQDILQNLLPTFSYIIIVPITLVMVFILWSKTY